MNRHLPALVAISLLAIACNAAGSPAGANLDGRAFVSIDVTANGVPRPLVPGTQIRLSFDSGNLGASAGCNHLGGSYRLEGGRLAVDAMAMTEMGCDAPRHAQDEWLSTFLGSRPQVRLNGAELVLDGGATVVRLLDTEVAEPDRPLTGTRWLLGSLIEGEAVSSVPAGVVATLELTADGNVSVNAGCNQGGGRYEVAGGVIRFSDIAMTRMACEGAAGQVEQQVLAVLGAPAVSYAIDGATLTLSADGRGLQYSAG